jgi:hypothetical protein
VKDKHKKMRTRPWVELWMKPWLVGIDAIVCKIYFEIETIVFTFVRYAV